MWRNKTSWRAACGGLGVAPQSSLQETPLPGHSGLAAPSCPSLRTAVAPSDSQLHIKLSRKEPGHSANTGDDLCLDAHPPAWLPQSVPAVWGSSHLCLPSPPLSQHPRRVSAEGSPHQLLLPSFIFHRNNHSLAHLISSWHLHPQDLNWLVAWGHTASQWPSEWMESQNRKARSFWLLGNSAWVDKSPENSGHCFIYVSFKSYENDKPRLFFLTQLISLLIPSSPKEIQLVSTKRPNVFSKDDVIWHQVFLKQWFFSDCRMQEKKGDVSQK